MTGPTIAQRCKRDPHLFCPGDDCGHGQCARFAASVEALRAKFSRSLAMSEPANRP